jgi:hypothetical protein
LAVAVPICFRERVGEQPDYPDRLLVVRADGMGRIPKLSLVCRDIGDQALLVGDRLHLTWHVA